MTLPLDHLTKHLKGTVHLHRDEPMWKHTTFRIGGPADAYAVVRSRAELEAAVQAARELEIPHLILGGGSNLLIQDGGVRGFVIEVRARGVAGLPVQHAGEPVTIEAEAGAPLAALGRRSARLGLRGLEWAVDVPGTIGGAVVNNAGANGGAIADRLEAAAILDLDGEVRWWQPDELAFGYRRTVLKEARVMGPRPVVLAAKFFLQPAEPLSLAAAVTQYSVRRRQTQPVGACAGSMFKNPPPQAAGWFIDQAGLKGTRMGQAQISELHGNFMLNLGGATSEDVLSLVSLARQRVLAQFGVVLELEIQVVGEQAADAPILA